MLEEPGGIVSFYPWTVIFTIRVGEPEEKPAAVELGEQPEEQPGVRRPRARGGPSPAGGEGGIRRVSLFSKEAEKRSLRSAACEARLVISWLSAS
jgi:hypothetical protein